MRKIALCLAVIVSGCASAIMQGYVGKSISEPILDYGPPANVLDLPDGRRAFQWSINSSGAIPVTNYETTSAWVGGTPVYATGTSTNYIPYSSQCVYTLYAMPQGKDWIVTGYREPNLGCQ